ncbi:L,D-transpeptidase [Akkermansia glycaniphila]|uniref:L,D-transpeptidase n=1 Tax=Akkermansia glycaniphila TaxID=1679444 RepID=UPI001C01AFF2|nr:L,D-transpeptidase [Akkermansia glycaniphila]
MALSVFSFLRAGGMCGLRSWRHLASGAALAVAGLLSSCTMQKDPSPTKVVKDGIVVSVRDQKLALLRNGKAVRSYDISTSKYGVGSRSGSYKTPRGVHSVVSKVGSGQPKGMVFESCRPTGKVIRPNTPGHDQIVSRVMQLNGLESGNKNSFSRRIYIHGTAEESKIGTPASYGCIRMRSDDVVELYDLVARGDMVAIEDCSLATYLKAEKDARTPIVLADGSVAMPASADMAVQEAPMLASATADTDEEDLIRKAVAGDMAVAELPSKTKSGGKTGGASSSARGKKGASSRQLASSRSSSKSRTQAASSRKSSSKAKALVRNSSRKSSSARPKLVSRKSSLAASRSSKSRSRG